MFVFCTVYELIKLIKVTLPLVVLNLFQIPTDLLKILQISNMNTIH